MPENSIDKLKNMAVLDFEAQLVAALMVETGVAISFNTVPKFYTLSQQLAIFFINNSVKP